MTPQGDIYMGVGIAVGVLTFVGVLAVLSRLAWRTLRGPYVAFLIAILPLAAGVAFLCAFLAAPWWPVTLILYALAGLAAALLWS